MDEAFYVLEAEVEFSHLTMCLTLLRKMGRIFIPKNSWHGFANS